MVIYSTQTWAPGWYKSLVARLHVGETLGWEQFVAFYSGASVQYRVPFKEAFKLKG